MNNNKVLLGVFILIVSFCISCGGGEKSEAPKKKSLACKCMDGNYYATHEEACLNALLRQEKCND
jgi:hypothetical protein